MSFYNNNQITNPSTPIPKLSDIFLTVNTSEGTYMLKFDPSVRAIQLSEYSQKEFYLKSISFLLIPYYFFINIAIRSNHEFRSFTILKLQKLIFKK
ncbi:hypothetical protein C7V10_08270 [Elizabethkingia miricola]|nr:hypothetical protein C7V10_08270 [Elizabethkingia miricola]